MRSFFLKTRLIKIKAVLKLYLLVNGLWYILNETYFDMLRGRLFVCFKTWIRFIWFVKILRRIKLYDTNTQQEIKVSKNTICHNLKSLSILSVKSFTGFRTDLLLRPLSVIESIDKKTAKLLFVGPRAESELFLARGYGFNKKNIKGVDLISYSPKVDIGDMHNLPYDNDSWDVVLLGWVIAYSDSPEVACKEIVRVLKNNGVVAIGVQYHPLSIEEIKEKIGYVPGSNKRIQSTKEILEFFGDSVNHVYFQHDITPERSSYKGEILIIFSIKK